VPHWENSCASAPSLSEEDAEAFYMRVTASTRPAQRGGDGYGTKIYEVTPAMLLSVIGNTLPESWDDLRKDLFRIDAAEIDLEDIQRRLKAFELGCKAKRRRGIQGTRGRTSHYTRGTPGTTGQQDRPCTESSQPKETQRPAVPQSQRGIHPAGRCFAAIRSESCATTRGSPANP